MRIPCEPPPTTTGKNPAKFLLILRTKGAKSGHGAAHPNALQIYERHAFRWFSSTLRRIHYLNSTPATSTI
jgi:hypothetical protein